MSRQVSGEPERPESESRRPSSKPAWAARRSRSAAIFGVAFLGVAGVAALSVAIQWLSGVESILLLIVAVLFFVALWLLVVEAEDASAKEVGVALLTGLVLAGAAFVLNYLLSEALNNRDRDRRETEVRLAINRQSQRVFRGEDLSGLDLSGLDMSPVDDRRFDLSFANLSGANLHAANLPGAQLRNANLTDAKFEGADLSGAVLRGAELGGATFCKADLRGADLTDHQGDFAECDDLVMNSDTTCRSGQPPKFDAADDRFTCAAGQADDEPPPGRGVFLIPKSAEPGTIVGQVVGRASVGESLEYEIIAEDGCATAGECARDLFVISPVNGVVTTAKAFAGVERKRIELVVRVADGVSEPVDETLVIEIDPPPEAEELQATATFLVRPDAEVGSIIGRVVPDAGVEDASSLRYLRIAPADDRFIVDETTGNVTLNHVPEPGRTHSLSISVVQPSGGAESDGDDSGDDDSGANRVVSTVSVSVTVLADNLPPVIEAESPVRLSSDAESRAVVVEVVASDPDGDRAPQFSLDEDLEAPGSSCVTGDGPGFDIDQLGAIRLLDGAVLSPGRCSVTVTVRDSGVPTRSASARIVMEVVMPDADEESAGSEDEDG